MMFKFIRKIELINAYWNQKIAVNKKLHIACFGFIFFVFAIIIYRLNLYTPWVVDDLCKGYTVQQFHSFYDWYNHICHFYLGWGGRIWGELYALIFLYIPKQIFNYLNTIGYLILLVLIYMNIVGKLVVSISLLVYINFALFVCLPAFGQDILWISGSANYMWSSFIPLLFLSLWRIYENKVYRLYRHPIFLGGIFLLGIFTGWANENVSVAIIILLVGYTLVYRKKYKTIPAFAYAGFIGTVLGSIFLWAAPGNFARFVAEKHSTSVFKIVKTMIHNAVSLFDFNTALLLFICLAIFLILGKSKHKEVACVFSLSAVISAIAMGVVGGLHSRVFFSCIVFMIIAVGILYEDWNDNMTIRNIKAVITILLLLGSYNFYSYAKMGIIDYNNCWNENIRIIQQEKEDGNLDVTVNPITPKNRFCASYMLDDIKPASNNSHWLNKGVAKYYGLHTIQSAKIEN